MNGVPSAGLTRVPTRILRMGEGLRDPDCEPHARYVKTRIKYIITRGTSRTLVLTLTLDDRRVAWSTHVHLANML